MDYSSMTDQELLVLADELESLVTKLNGQQQGFKIAMNSLFGAIGNKWFRSYFDIRVAEAITSVGQTGIQYISRRLNEHFNAKMGTTGIKFTFYNDTDSVYMTVAPLIDSLFSKEQQDEINEVIKFMDNLFSEEIEPKLLEWAEELSVALNCMQNKLIFKRESLATCGVWTSKKHYALMVSNNEGVQYPKPKLKFTGLEAKKSDYPAFCRSWLKECYEIVMTQGEEALHARVKEIKGEFMGKQIHEIAAPKSVNDIEKWVDGHEHLNLLKGAPAQVKAAVNYNKLLRQSKLQMKPIASGDKILRVPLKKGAPAGMDIIGFPDYLPPEFDLDRWVDRVGSFDKFFISPLTNFIKAVGWSHEPQASAMGFFV